MRAIILALALAGCAKPAIVKERVSTVSVPVVQKCAADKPAKVQPLNQRYTDAAWLALSPKQRAEIVAAQAARRMNYADELDAATSAC